MSKWLVGLISGGVAAVVAALVSLPLESPDDAVLNSGTVAIGALITGLAIGAAWAAFRDQPAVYGAALIAAAVAVFIIAALFAAKLDGSYAYVVPLGLIVVGICAVLTPVAERLLPEGPIELGASGAGLVAALVVGLALAGQGDNEAEDLEFPELRNTPVATSPSATEPGETAAAETPSTGGTITADDVEGVAYEVVPDESTVQYTVTEQLQGFPSSSDAQGQTSLTSGTVYLDGQESTFTFDASTFTSDQDRRDNYIRSNIFAPDPIVTFVVDDLTGLPATYTAGEEVTMQVSGTATVVGVSQPLTFDVTGRFDGEELQLLGDTQFMWADFNITPPNTAIVTVQDEVRIEVLVIARVPLSS
jgi:polyisoprenoid-binding protein YceI